MEHYPALIVAVNGIRARWFVISQDRMIVAAGMRDTMDRYTDREGFFLTRGHGFTMRSGEPDVMSARRLFHTRAHLARAAEETAALWRSGSYAHCVVMAPASYRRLFVARITHAGVPAGAVRIADGNVVNESADRIRHRFQQSLLPR